MRRPVAGVVPKAAGVAEPSAWCVKCHLIASMSARASPPAVRLIADWGASLSASLGGLAAVAALTTLFNDKIPLDIRTTALRLVFVILAIVWIAIALLDQVYYQRLLTGVVGEIRRARDRRSRC